MMTLKIGTLDWIDAPYSVHLSKNLTKLAEPEAGCGLALTLMLIDSSTGKIMSMRLIGLAEDFTRSLLDAARQQQREPFSRDAYNQSIRLIYSSFSTEQIAAMSENYCRLLDGGMESRQA